MSFVHAPPESAFEHRRFFRAPLVFDSPADEIDPPRRRRGGCRCARPTPALATVVRRQLEKLLEQHGPEGDASTAAAVRRILIDEAGRREPGRRRPWPASWA